MKVDLETFNPVTITLETAEELRLLYALISSHEIIQKNCTTEVNEFREKLKQHLNGRLYL